ncbi:MAG: transporter, partial [Muribaculaceae bacterium]|nr:transporter [Muribaculaceae bacterium]
MDWFQNLFTQHSAVQAVALLSVIIAIGLGLGKLRVAGISLGVTFVFFTGILAGHLGFSIDEQMLIYAENFGLVLFVYELGLKVGPGFFSSFRSGGIRLNSIGLGLVLAGAALTIALSYAFSVPMSDMAGIMCGATTNTPALGAAQQALQQLGVDANGAALSCAVTYPLGVVGVIIALVILRKVLARPADLLPHPHDDADHTFVAEFAISNPALFGLTIKDIRRSSGAKFVISRLWRAGQVSIPGPDARLEKGDHVLAVCNDNEVKALTVIFGERLHKDWNKSDIDWNSVDKELVSQKVVISRPGLNGKRLGALKLRNQYGVNI